MEVDFTQRWRERRTVFLQKQIFFNPRRHEVEKIPVKLAADWIVKNHYLGSFPSATVCYGIFRNGELSGVAVLGTAQHKNTVPNVFGSAHSNDCLLLQRFALEMFWSLMLKAIFPRVAQKGRILRRFDDER
jgi:hypothetical protein